MNWQASRHYKIGLSIAIIASIILIVLVNRYLYFPGDIGATKALQSLLPHNNQWAITLTTLAKFPWYFILLALAFFTALISVNMRAAILSLFSFAGLWLIDKGLSFVVFQPRPSASLIQVQQALSSSAFPSTSALIYASTFGFLLLLSLKFHKGSLAHKIIIVVSTLVLCAVFLARIALGAHWPSDLLISYLLGAVWILALLPFASKSKA